MGFNDFMTNSGYEKDDTRPMCDANPSRTALYARLALI